MNMVRLLEIKEIIVNTYKQFERYILLVGKFILAFIVISQLNSFLGLNDMLNKGIVTLAISGVSVILPGSWFVLMLIFFICGHLYALSIELTVVLFIVMATIYLLFIRVFPKNAYWVVIVPLALIMKIGYVVPIVAGLFIGPSAILAIASGILVHKSAAYLPGLINMKSEELYDIPTTVINMLKYLIDVVTEDKAMLLTIVVFSIVVVAVYLVTQFSFDYIFYIAIGIGGVINILAFVIGIIFTGAEISIGGVVFGTLIAIILSAVCQFFRFSLDYNRQSKVQFEDDDYYYYVKAIPKTKVTKTEKEVKKIK